MQRPIIFLTSILFIASCTAPPATVQSEPTPAPKLTGNETKGEVAIAVYSWCAAESRRQCPRPGTIYCDSYFTTFVKGCMLRAGVPPEYIMTLVP